MAITSINLGKIKFNWRGAWTLGTDYVKDDVVRYNGSSYVVITGHTSATSWATNSSKFELMAEGTTPTTTKGDLIYRGDVNDMRLGIGNPGQVLSVEDGIPAWLDNGVNEKIYYVSPAGSDTNSGLSWGTAFASINYACTQAVGPATIYVASGTYSEQLPIVVPSFVAVIGDSIRTTIIGPQSGYEQTTMWKMGDGAMLNKMHFIGLTGFVPYAPDDQNIEQATVGGVYVGFDEDVPIATKSPYVIECTAKSSGAIGALVDGSVHTTGIKSMVFHGYTVILDGGIGYWIKDNGKSEIVSCFTYYCHAGYVTTGGGKIRALNGNNSYGTYGTIASGYNLTESTLNGQLYGEQIEYTPASLSGGSFGDGETITGGTSGATGTITNVQAGAAKVYYKSTNAFTFQAGETITSSGGASATIASGGVTGQKGFVLVATGLTTEPKPGGSVELTGDAYTYVIQSVSGWVNSSSNAVILLAGEKSSATADGTQIKIRYDYSNVRLTGHDFLSIGTGGIATTNYPGIPFQAPAQGNEVIEKFPARCFYVSTDQDGNFRVGEYFKVDQATGRATLNASAFDLSGLTSLRLGSIGAQLGELVNEFSSDTTLSGNSNAAVPTEKAVKTYFTKISSNNAPSADNLYSLGTADKRWSHLYVGPGSITIGSLTITDNSGTLEVKATSGGAAAPTLINAINNGTSNVSVANNADITMTAGGTLGQTISSTSITSALPHSITSSAVSSSTSTGALVVTGGVGIGGTLYVGGDILFGGEANQLSATQLNIDDAIIYMANTNPADILDIGLLAAYNDGTHKHTGLLRDATDGVWKFFTAMTSEPTTVADFTGVTYAPVKMGALTTDSVNGLTVTASTGTLTVTNGKTVSVSNTLTFTGTDSSSVAFGAGGTVAYTSDKLSAFSATTSAELAGVISDETGTGVLVFGTSPNITTSLTTASTSFDLINANATTVNFAGAASTLKMGASNTSMIVGGGSANASSVLTVNQSTSSSGTTGITLAQAGTGQNGLFLTRSGGTTASWTLYQPQSSSDFRIYSGSDLMTLTSAGNVTFAGTMTSNSDASLKTNVETISNALDKVLALRGVMFDRISTGQREVGTIAQEVEQVVPELVFTDENGIKSVAYANTVALLIEAIKEQQTQINQLKGNN